MSLGPAPEQDDQDDQTYVERAFYQALAESRGRLLLLKDAELKHLRCEQQWQDALAVASRSPTETEHLVARKDAVLWKLRCSDAQAQARKEARQAARALKASEADKQIAVDRMQEFQNANLGSSKQFEKLQNDIQKIQAREAEAKENLLKALDKIEVLQQSVEEERRTNQRQADELASLQQAVQEKERALSQAKIDSAIASSRSANRHTSASPSKAATKKPKRRRLTSPVIEITDDSAQSSAEDEPSDVGEPQNSPKRRARTRNDPAEQAKSKPAAKPKPKRQRKNADHEAAEESVPEVPPPTKKKTTEQKQTTKKNATKTALASKPPKKREATPEMQPHGGSSSETRGEVSDSEKGRARVASTASVEPPEASSPPKKKKKAATENTNKRKAKDPSASASPPKKSKTTAAAKETRTPAPESDPPEPPDRDGNAVADEDDEMPTASQQAAKKRKIKLAGWGSGRSLLGGDSARSLDLLDDEALGDGSKKKKKNGLGIPWRLSPI